MEQNRSIICGQDVGQNLEQTLWRKLEQDKGQNLEHTCGRYLGAYTGAGGLVCQCLVRAGTKLASHVSHTDATHVVRVRDTYRKLSAGRRHHAGF